MTFHIEWFDVAKLIAFTIGVAMGSFIFRCVEDFFRGDGL